MTIKILCTSCKRNVGTEDHWTRFKCPNCGEEEIVRCERCRKLSIPYVCSKCGFEGP